MNISRPFLLPAGVKRQEFFTELSAFFWIVIEEKT